MNSLRFTYMILLLMTGGLYGGDFVTVEKGDDNYKKLKLSVVVKKHIKDKDRVSVKVTIGKAKLEGLDIGDVFLFSDSRNSKITPKAKDREVIIDFEIAKAKVKGSRLHFSYRMPSPCPPAYALELSQYIK